MWNRVKYMLNNANQRVFHVRKLDGNATMYNNCNSSVIDKVCGFISFQQNAKLKQYFVVKINGLWQHNYMVC